MSLVNNMLRDLDQRRKESDSSGASVRLMPAREYVEEGGRKLLPFILVGLALVAAALVFYWFQFGQSESSQQLDIRVQPIAANSDRLIEELEESIVVAEQAEAAQVGQSAAQIGQSAAQAEVEAAPISLDSILSAPIENASIASVGNATQSAIVESTPIPEIPISSGSVAAVSPDSRVEADPQLVRNGPVGSVKEAPEYSTEQLDTIAVQKALQQIADGQADAANKTLEDYIVLNRYAHQSRETFAKLLMSQGRVADAAGLIDAGLQLAPNHTGFKKVKARLLMAGGQISEAVDILISRAPDVTVDSEYHDLLASAQLSSRDFAGAVISYTGLVQTDETQGKWWYGFASAHDQLGNVLPARQAYTRAMQFSNLSANLRRRSQERLGALNP